MLTLRYTSKCVSESVVAVHKKQETRPVFCSYVVFSFWSTNYGLSKVEARSTQRLSGGNNINNDIKDSPPRFSSSGVLTTSDQKR